MAACCKIYKKITNGQWMTALKWQNFEKCSAAEVKDCAVNSTDAFQRVTASHHCLVVWSQPLTLHDTTLCEQMVYGHKHADGVRQEPELCQGQRARWYRLVLGLLAMKSPLRPDKHT